MFTFPILLTIYAGFTHAFEADHLLAISNIVSRRNNVRSSIKDGIFWGLGHASTIFFIGILIIVFKASISGQYFHYFESIVGIMLIALALYRLIQFYKARKDALPSNPNLHGREEYQHVHVHANNEHHHKHTLAYGVGLVHGLAGSGALILIAMSQMKSSLDGVLYLIIFGGGCIIGMLVAAGFFSIPFSKKLLMSRSLQGFLIIATSLLCFVYGGKVIYENLFA